MELVIVGPGRLGRTLAELLVAAGHQVTLWGRDEPPPMPSHAVRLLTVPDPAIAEVSRKLPPGGPVLHCAGALSHDILRPHAVVGSFHPLMTFPGPDVAIPDLAGVPVAVAGDPGAQEVARKLAIELKMQAFEVPGDRRLYHAAAVMAGNLAMVLVAEASRVLAAAGVPADQARDVLVPLAERSVHNAAQPLGRVLTGPLARGDLATIEGHRAALGEQGLSDALDVYNRLTRIAEVHLGRREAEK